MDAREALDPKAVARSFPHALEEPENLLEIEELKKFAILAEISALSRYPVSATVRARADVQCLLIRTPALRILQRSAPKFKEFVDRRYREHALASHLRNVGLFARCDEKFIKKMKERVE